MRYPKPEKFNVRVYADYKNGITELRELDCILIEKYGVKVLLHETIESLKMDRERRYKSYNISEYYTGMMVVTVYDTIRECFKQFEKLFNDQDLTEFGRQEKLRKFQNIINDNVKIYGKANN